MPGGQNLTGVFAADLAYADVKQLKAQQARSVPDLTLQDCMQNYMTLARCVALFEHGSITSI